MGNLKNKLYPYLISIVVAIYISTQFLSIASTSNIGVTLQEVAMKQTVIFDFLITQSIESAARTSMFVTPEEFDKEMLLQVLSYNQNIQVYDLNIFLLDGTLMSENFEGYQSFKSVFGDLRLDSILEPLVINIRYSELYKDNVMDILVPVFQDKKLTAIMWQTESFERINSAIKNVSILETGESYIIDEYGKVLTELRYADISKSSITIKQSSIITSTLDQFEKKTYLDYNDTSVYGYHKNLKFNRWKLVVEVNEDEVINATANINSFLLSSITLVLAAAKLLEPLTKNMMGKNKDPNLSLEDLKELVNCTSIGIKQPFQLLKCYYLSLRNIYRKHKHKTNIFVLVIIIFTTVIGIGSVKTDQDIQNNLNLSNQVNRRLISYYISELKGRFYSLNRIIIELPEVDLYPMLNSALKTNQDMLNILVLDSDGTLIYQCVDKQIQLPYANQAIQNQSTIYHSIGISDIFYDKNYEQYVFYFSSKVFDHQNQLWYDTIGVVSVNNLTNLINNNELHGSRIISLLNNNKIMYSNQYKQNELPPEHFNHLKKNLDTLSVSSNVFNINKYKNLEGVDVYGNFASINNQDILVYGSYGTIDNTEWQLLYEEPVSLAKKRVFESSINLLIDMIYQYIENTINSLK